MVKPMPSLLCVSLCIQALKLLLICAFDLFKTELVYY